jgi:hypothetical protein
VIDDDPQIPLKNVITQVHMGRMQRSL